MFLKENIDKMHTINWIVPNAQKNMLEPIIVEIQPNGETEEDQPHQGEEFGYVLTGSIILFIGNKKYKVKKDECFYYKANKSHHIKNSGKTAAKIIWISTPPSF